MRQYFILSDCCVAKIHKVASTSLAEAIAENFYPHRAKGDEPPWTYKPDRPVRMFMRNPVERFISSITMFNSTVERAFDELMKDMHFIPQSDYALEGTRLYRFPEQIKEFCQETGILNLPHLRKTSKPKVEITEAQRMRIQEYYSKDMELVSCL